MLQVRVNLFGSRGPRCNQTGQILGIAGTGNCLPLPDTETPERPGADPLANQAERRVADSSSHAANLPIATFRDDDLQPACGNVLADADGRVAVPDRRWGHRLHPRRLRAAVFKDDPRGKLPSCGSVGDALYLNPVGLGELVARVRDRLLEVAGIGEHQQAFAIEIQASGCIHPRYINKVFEGRSVGCIGELTQDAKRFVEQQ